MSSQLLKGVPTITLLEEIRNRELFEDEIVTTVLDEQANEQEG